ncbi:MAG: glycoside hydrolase family 16 protein [Clostridium sp.]|nr:glycoside hydrolase family 16 protein [Clostridium sp.]
MSKMIREMERILALCAAALTGIAAWSGCPETAVCEGETLRLAWHDEFDGDGAPDARYWSFEEGFARNHEDQWYQAENAWQEDGALVIEARREPAGRANPLYRADGKDWRSKRPEIEYTSASINTKGRFSFAYGRVEVRAKIPTASGAWPAIWLLGDEMEWPSCGEIDMMEYYRINGEPHILANACWGNDRPYQAVWNSKTVPFAHFTDEDPQWAEKFHIWAMDWTPEAINLYLDDELINRIPLSQTTNGSIGGGTNPFTKPQYLLLNLALGGDHGDKIDDEAMPMRYIVDYVRVYSADK